MTAPKGRIELICGPMWAGKSTELLRRIRRYAITYKNIAVFTHKKDVRFGKDMAVTTHDAMVTHEAASFQVHAISKLSGRRATDAAAHASCIGIDEGQFFGDVVVMCNKWADEGKIVIIAALDTTFERKPFDTMVQLCPDTIDKFTAVCFYCSSDAPFTRRITDETEVEVVGAEDKYEAVCRACYVDKEAEARATPRARAPQPPPVRCGSAVPPVFQEWARANGYADAVELSVSRAAFGEAKYGQPLMTEDGRDSIEDAKDEIGDFFHYLQKAIVNGEDVNGLAPLMKAASALLETGGVTSE